MEEKLNEKEILEQIKRESLKGISLTKLCETLNLDPIELFGYIKILRDQDINIITKVYDDGVRILYKGEKSFDEDNTYHFKTDENNEFKFVAISDTRFGSMSQQLSILNHIYKQAKEQGYNTVIHCGNLTEGLYPMTNVYSDTLFLDDTLRQVNYIVENYPKVDGIKTCFITGVRDEKHLKNNQINIGKRISDQRSDMIYLGAGSCDVKIDNTSMKVYNNKLAKTYTVSYRAQQQVDSFRSEDKPDIVLYGGLLQTEKFNYRDVECISVPSVCATTKEMSDKRYSNTVGAWFITVKTNKKGQLESIQANDAIFYNTCKNDYLNSSSVNKKEKNIYIKANDDAFFKKANKVYRFIKNGMRIEDFMKKFQCDSHELKGILELCKMYGKNIEIVFDNNDNAVFKKITPKRQYNRGLLSLDELNHTELCVVSDTHLGNNRQQLHLLNRIYLEAYNRGIDTVLHCGDLVDGNYPIRKENGRLQFLHGFDDQVGYVVDMYPKITGITTKYILGSHDETHYKNGGATVNEWLSRCRPDMLYLGQDTGSIEINNVKIILDHPGGGSAQSISYKPQKRIEILESSCKPDILLIGHYHKNYAFVYRGVHGIEVPALCDKTQFQQKQGLSNSVGAYFLDIYSDNQGNIQYFKPEVILFGKKDMWDEVGKDKHKVKQLVID